MLSVNLKPREKTDIYYLIIIINNLFFYLVKIKKNCIIKMLNYADNKFVYQAFVCLTN